MRSISGIIRTTAGIVIALVLIATPLVIAERPSVRYSGNQFPSLYHAIYGQEGPVDIVFMGTSRVRRAIYAPYLSKSLAPYFGGREPVIYDLAFPHKGVVAEISVILDFLEERKAKYVFLQYSLSSQHLMHVHFHKVGRLKDIVTGPFYQDSLFDEINVRSELIYQRVAYALDFCLSQLVICLGRHQKIPAETVDGSEPRTISIERMAQKLVDPPQEIRKRAWKLGTPSHRRAQYYLDRLVSVAREKGVTLVLIDVPRLEWSSIDPEFASRVEKRFGVAYLYSGPDFVKQVSPVGYGDGGHLNLRGSKRFEEVIIEYFRRQQ